MVDRRRALAALAIVAALSAGYVGASYAATGGVAGSARATDTEPPPADTTPAPDPAPPAPTPKPAPKPAPKAVSHPAPAPVYHAPAPTPSPQPTYTPPPVVHHAKPKVVHHRKHKRKKAVAPAPVKPKTETGEVKAANIVGVTPIPAAATAANTNGDARSVLVIAGLVFASLLFFIVWAIPTTPARFTQAGRVVMDHQTELLLTGIGTLLLTIMLFLLTSGA